MHAAMISIQIPLVHIVDRNDKILLKSANGEWFRTLYGFPWTGYRMHAAKYYDALYQFNKKEDEMSEMKDVSNEETREAAEKRLLFDRVTMQKTLGRKPVIIFQGKEIDSREPAVDPNLIAPGIVPDRFVGRKPKDFFALFKSFLGATLMGFPPEPESVHLLLTTNIDFIRVCGFVPKEEKDEYCFMHAPSLRKLEQFDQIMTESGLWNEIKLDEVRKNLESGLINKEKELVADTTHYYAYSGFRTVKYTDEQGKEQKKSQSKLTKPCRCEDRESCRHDWELADDGAGTIVKSNKKMHWGHKASIIGLPKQGIPLDAAAVTDASVHDGETLYPHVKKLFNDYPEIKDWGIERVLYDSACDGKDLKELFRNELSIDLKTSLNPRRTKDVTEGLPRGIQKITPYGEPVCIGGHEMDYKGVRFENEKFIYQAPVDDKGVSACVICENKNECCPNALTGRTITISFDVLPHIDSNDPPMAKRFKAIMSRRPSVERMIKRLKCDMGDDRLSKRGTASFQAYLDKTMIGFHQLLRL